MCLNLQEELRCKKGHFRIKIRKLKISCNAKSHKDPINKINEVTNDQEISTIYAIFFPVCPRLTQILLISCRNFNLQAILNPRMTSTVGPLSPEPREVGENGGGGGPGGVPEGGGGEGGGAAPPTSLNLSKTSLPVLLITANVGSIFDDPKNLVPQWLAQVCRQIKASQAAFVAIHCQEVREHACVNEKGQ